MFNIIKTATLNIYRLSYPEADEALKKWYYDLKTSSFKNANELKEVYASASILADNRVIFNICGNKYRLIVRINYQYRAIMIKWFGTHKEYDKIDASTVQFEL
jgi:mRNA interferase HigB